MKKNQTKAAPAETHRTTHDRTHLITVLRNISSHRQVRRNALHAKSAFAILAATLLVILTSATLAEPGSIEKITAAGRAHSQLSAEQVLANNGAVQRTMKAKEPDARVPHADAEAGGDAEILALILAVNTNQLIAAMEAEKRILNPATHDYATMLRVAHGKIAVETMKLGLMLDVTPLDTDESVAVRAQSTTALAAIIPLNDVRFGAAFVTAMVNEHIEVLAMIDMELLPNAKHESIKKQLLELREQISTHLGKAKALLPAANPPIAAQ